MPFVRTVAITDSPGRNRSCFCLARIEHDLHRYSLHYLRVIARRIVGRQQGELRAAGGRDMIDLPSENYSWKCIHPYFSRVARADVTDLRFFVISVYPNVALNERDNLSARTD